MTTTELQLRAEEAEELAQCLLDFARNLRNRPSKSETPRIFWPDSQPALSQAITNILALRRRRPEQLEAALFGEPAWDMLLVLFKASLDRTELTIEEVCKSSGTYESTARRWMAVLVDQHMAELDCEERDDRLKTVRLTEQGSIRMTKILLELR